MKDDLLIIGAGGHGKVAADVAIKMKKWKNIAFLEDYESINTCIGLKVKGKSSDAYKFKEKADFFVAIGNNSTRENVQNKLVEKGLSVVNKLVHPSSVIGTDVVIGIGSIIMAGAVINSSTIIGEGCIVNTSSSIDHDNFLDDYVHVSPGVRTAGNVKIGKGTWLGIGCIISNNINICSGCNLGAGTVVIKDITNSSTYVGVPVKRLY